MSKIKNFVGTSTDSQVQVSIKNGSTTVVVLKPKEGEKSSS